MANPESYMFTGPMPDLRKMKASDVKAECKVWRKIWQWTPEEVRYYMSRVGSTIGVTMRNYKRYMGPLVGVKFDLVELDVGTLDKVFDPVKDAHFYEQKVIRMKTGGIIDIQWIIKRKSEEEYAEEVVKEIEQEPNT